MSISEKCAFPVSISEENAPWEKGMTYREWLIGQALPAALAIERQDMDLSPDLRHGVVQLGRVARMAIMLADAVISQMRIERNRE